MHDDPFRAVFAQIAEADMIAPCVRTGIRLLHSCPDSGHALLSWPDFLSVSGCRNKQAARRHLRILEQCGIIRYHTNERVSVNFAAYHAPRERADAPTERVDAPTERVIPNASTVRAPRERVDAPRGRADAPTERAGRGTNPSAIDAHAPRERVDAPTERVIPNASTVHAPRERVDAPRERADAPRERVGGGKGGAGWLDGWINRFNRLKDPSIQPSSYAPPGEDEKDLSEKMLYSLGVPADLAEHIATILHPEDIYSQGLRYIADREDPKRESPGLGALMHRLADPRGFLPQPPTEEDERTPFAEKYGPLLREFRWRQKNPEEAAESDAEAAIRLPTDRTGEESERD